MNRKIKALGLALVAAFAMSAVMASAASAGQFHAGEAHTILSGEQVGSHEFTVGAGFGAITCSTAKFAGTSTAATESSQTITPEYTGCKDSFGRTADVHVTSHYLFTPPAEATKASNVHVKATSKDAEGNIIEPAFTISITSGGSVICTVKVPSQTNNNIVYHNVANGDVEVTTTTNNVTTETSGGFFNCGVTNGHHTGGSYTGNSLTKGTSTAGANVNISVS